MEGYLALAETALSLAPQETVVPLMEPAPIALGPYLLMIHLHQMHQLSRKVFCTSLYCLQVSTFCFCRMWNASFRLISSFLLVIVQVSS